MDQTNSTTIREAFNAILTQCDGAHERDAVGFNAPDATLSRRLVRRGECWGEHQDYEAWTMLAKYRAQLHALGIDYDALPAPPKPAIPKSGRFVTRVPDQSILKFGFEYGEKSFDAIKRALKESLGARWDADNKVWRVAFTPATRDGIITLVDLYDFELSGGAIDLLNSDPAELPPPPKPKRTITATGNQWLIAWGKGDPDFSDLLAETKALPRRTFKSELGGWLAPASEALLEICDGFEVEGREALRTALDAATEQKAVNLVASRAEDAEINVEGLGGTLRPFQKAGVAYALRAKRTFIADEMGLGKTVQALATIHAANAYPALVVCPASVKLNWEREAHKWLPSKSVSVWNGKAGASDADVIVINYDVLKKHAEALKAIHVKTVVYDESHYVKNHAAQRTEAAKALARGAEYRLALTGTPVLNRPQELLSQLGILGRLDDLGGFWEFAKRYCRATKGRFGWDFSGANHLDELNEKMRACCFIRRNKADVLTELPAKQRAEVTIEIDNRREYERAERELIAWLKDRAANDASFLASIAHLDPQGQGLAKSERAQSAGEKAARAEQLVRIEALKQLSAQGKLKAVKDWTNSFIESEKLVLFASHIEIQKALLAEFPDAAHVFGEDSTEERQRNVDRFQNDPRCSLIVCSLAAAGVGITLTAASNVAFMELGWNPAAHDQAEDRTHRIGQTNQVTAWYLLASNTIDQEIHALIEAKRAVVDAATDGTTTEANDAGILNALIAKLTEQQ